MVNSTAGSWVANDATQASLTTNAGSNGSIVVQTAAGNHTLSSAVTANGSGNILLQAQGAGTSAQGNATVQSGTGNVTVLAAQGVAFAAGDAIETGGGTVDAEAGTGSITFDPAALVGAPSPWNSDAAGGAVRLLAAANITVGGVTAGTANVSFTATAGTIYDGGNATYAEQRVVAAGLRLSAGTGAGPLSTHLVTHVATLAAVAGSGGIFVSNDVVPAVGSVAATVDVVNDLAAAPAATDSALSGLTTSSRGAVVLQTTAGT